MYDATVIGSGPNGLAAAIRLVQQGLSVKIYEKADTVGGGTRTKELTLPGFKHDVCSAIHPLANASPFFQSLPLEDFGFQWVNPEIPVAHPFDDRPAGVLFRSFQRTIDSLGDDGSNYESLLTPFLDDWHELLPQLLAPFSLVPRHPLQIARFGLKGLQSANRVADKFSTTKFKGLFAGLAAHGMLPFNKAATAAIGLILGITAHSYGWPFPKGGSHAITLAMADYLQSMGGEIETGAEISSLKQLSESRIVLFDTTPRQILEIAGERLPADYAKKLRSFQYGSGVFKMDFALSDPIPWSDELCQKAGTVHLGGTFNEIAAAESAVANGKHPQKPYVLAAQQSLFDKSRTPDGRHTGWAYCHVPNGSARDMSESIINQIERFAPGFRDCIMEQHSMNTNALQAYNPNYIGGDINGGRQDIMQLFSRPAGLFNPYQIPKTNMFICSSSTPPGGGVHAMCGYHAAESAIKY